VRIILRSLYSGEREFRRTENYEARKHTNALGTRLVSNFVSQHCTPLRQYTHSPTMKMAWSRIERQTMCRQVVTTFSSCSHNSMMDDWKYRVTYTGTYPNRARRIHTTVKVANFIHRLTWPPRQSIIYVVFCERVTVVLFSVFRSDSQSRWPPNVLLALFYF